MKINMDIDIDVADRNEILSILPHIPASSFKKEKIEKHPVGVYFQNIPMDPFTNLSSIDYHEAEELGYMKFDFINNSIYSKVKSREHLDELVNREPIWELLQHKEFVEMLHHIHNYHHLCKKFKPSNIEELAAILALIRPAKRHLQSLSKEEMLAKIWKDNGDEDSYRFKRSHSYAYSLSIIVQMNLLVEELNREDE